MKTGPIVGATTPLNTDFWTVYVQRDRDQWYATATHTDTGRVIVTANGPSSLDVLRDIALAVDKDAAVRL
jgi:hypothetical protein